MVYAFYGLMPRICKFTKLIDFQYFIRVSVQLFTLKTNYYHRKNILTRRDTFNSGES